MDRIDDEIATRPVDTYTLVLTREQMEHLVDQLEDSIAWHANTVEIEGRPDTDWKAVRVRVLKPIEEQLRERLGQ